ncbi:MAG TPA: hypothetical protein VEJ88_02705 [Dissulfurispiraceae bacterium]|nr:hypothetical protein [Dissulfurispiraceae bacterium]
MLKKQWNTLKHRQKAKGDWLKVAACPTAEKVALCLLTFAFCMLFFSCAPKYAERPSRQGLSLSDILAKMNTVQSVEAVLSIDYEKNDATLSGDAFLNLSPSALDLRIYYLGFLAGQVKEDNGVIKSKPKLDKFKSVVLVDGLRNSFLWWTISDYTVLEKDDSYVLRNFNRQLIISKKNLLPLEQTIQLDNGEEMTISYDAPAYNKPETEENRLDPEIAWYQSHLLIRYRNHQVKVRVKSYIAKTQAEANKSR